MWIEGIEVMEVLYITRPPPRSVATAKSNVFVDISLYITDYHISRDLSTVAKWTHPIRSVYAQHAGNA